MRESPDNSRVEYVIGGQELTSAEQETAAWQLAEDAMRIRCGRSPVLERWRARRDGGPPETGTRKAAVEAYAGIGFGLPGAPADDDHLQGHVAELLWNRLIQERLMCRDSRRLVHAHSVKPDPLEPGGDGLVVYEINGGTLVFRLWEIKKHDSQARVSATIRRASQQLSSRGQEYLAKLAGPETVEQEGPLGELYADIVELWLDGSEQAGAGVSVGTSARYSPSGPPGVRFDCDGLSALQAARADREHRRGCTGLPCVRQACQGDRVERALNLGLLSAALAGRTGLPTAEELQQLMADVEVQLLLRRAEIPQELVDAAWYLHAVASVNQARERYTAARQRQAFQVSAHIFDLTLNQFDLAPDQGEWSPVDRVSFGFAAAIGYRRGGRDPNATAIMNRLRADINVGSPVLDHMDSLSLEAGLALLGFETRTLFTWLGTWRQQLAVLARASQLEDLTTTAFGATQMVVLGAGDLLEYFARGDRARLERGRARLRTAAIGQAGPGDLNARWVAAHLLALSGEAEVGSLWNPNVLPPIVPTLVRQAFTIGSPPVLTLWEPQRDLLTGDRSPFDPGVRRMVLAVPTSGGKTLLAQMLAVEHLARTDRSVCYVAPTRSLCREVRRAMTNRVRILQKETGPDLPDFPAMGELFDVLGRAEPADVEVMTTERLAHLLRHDAPAVLERFGMFIFDEAQLLKEAGRGFVLESVIALLDYLSRHTDHQIVLISAAMGNAGAIAEWLSPDGQALRHESQWRGPRRLHAAFTTEAQWEDTRLETIAAGRVWPYRLVTPLRGEVRLRMANGRTARLSTQGDTGWRLVRKSKVSDLVQRGLDIDNGRSTKRYVIASEMIIELGHAGSVLLVANTRDQAQLLATLSRPRAVHTAQRASHRRDQADRRGRRFRTGRRMTILGALDRRVRAPAGSWP
jgi:hypothetical protein